MGTVTGGVNKRTDWSQVEKNDKQRKKERKFDLKPTRVPTEE